MRTALLLLSVVAILGSPARVQAETDSEKAKRLFREGTNHYDLGEFPKAVEAYKAGYLIKQDPIFLFNIAQAFRMLKDYDQAVIFYKSYLRNRPDAPNRDDVVRRIEEMEAAGRAPIPPPQRAPAPVATPTATATRHPGARPTVRLRRPQP